MDTLSSIKDLINLWPTRAVLAEEMRACLGGAKCSTDQVHKWANSGSIPPRYHQAILDAARLRGFDVDAELIVRLHAFLPPGAAPGRHTEVAAE